MAFPPKRPIQILPENVVHKIAAGEVVERPASVVKELVENAIDAGARRISVEIEQGGSRSIVVSDDGCGIPAQEIPLALKRHATSKITSPEDLFSLNTLGFRGEALPSIASVSRFRLETATAESDPVGYALEVQEGRVGELQETAMPRGTRITVKDLFCTTPARLKFMKRAETEWGHILDYLTAMALSHPEIEWRLHHNGKKSLFCPPVSEAKERVLDLFGRDAQSSLYPIDRQVSELSLKGLISHPNFSQRTNRQLFVYVNGRYVQDRLINHAIVTGYRGLLMTQQFPMAILDFRLNPALVDVNVHPTKREVRFSNSNSIHHLISETIRSALERTPWRETQATRGLEGRSFTETAEQFPSREVQYSLNPANRDFDSAAAREKIHGALREFGQRQGMDWGSEAHPMAKIGNLAFGELQVIGQFNQTYLVCAHQESLILIDQHAAHERIGFEQLKKSFGDGRLPSQRLIQPLAFDLSEFEAQQFKECLPELERFGFEAEEFGENTFVLKSHPVLLKDCDWIAVLKEIVDELESPQRMQALEERVDHVLATMACHRQVRAGDFLRQEEMLELVRQLEGTPRSYHCPHGRPVMVEIEGREIERWFKRVL